MAEGLDGTESGCGRRRFAELRDPAWTSGQPRNVASGSEPLVSKSGRLTVVLALLAVRTALAGIKPGPEPCNPSLVATACLTGDVNPTNTCVNEGEIGSIDDPYAGTTFRVCGGLYPWI
jgi:hypothetical protein